MNHVTDNTRWPRFRRNPGLYMLAWVGAWHTLGIPPVVDWFT